MKLPTCLSALFLGLLALGAAAQTPPAPATCADPRPLRLSLAPTRDPAALLMQYQPLIRQLEIAMDRRVEALPAASYGAVVEGLLKGEIDIASLGPAAYAIAMSRGAKISTIASFTVGGGATTPAGTTYHSLLITSSSADFQSVEQLRGATLSLTDPASASGAILPRHAMEKLLGMPLSNYFKRVSFAGSHDRAIDIVRRGQVDAAFVSSTAVDDAIRSGRMRMDDIRILWKSAPIPYDPFVQNTRLCPALVGKIRQVFLGDTLALQGMFKELGMTGFAPVTDDQYGDIRALFRAPP